MSTNTPSNNSPIDLAKKALASWDRADGTIGSARQSLAYAIILVAQSSDVEGISTAKLTGWHGRKETKGEKTLSRVQIALLGTKPTHPKSGKNAVSGKLISDWTKSAGRVRLGLMLASVLLSCSYATASFVEGTWQVKTAHIIGEDNVILLPKGSKARPAVLPLNGASVSYLDGDSFKSVRVSVETFLRVAGAVHRGTKEAAPTPQAKALSGLVAHMDVLKDLATNPEREADRAGIEGSTMKKLQELASFIGTIVTKRQVEKEAADKGDGKVNGTKAA